MVCLFANAKRRAGVDKKKTVRLYDYGKRIIALEGSALLSLALARHNSNIFRVSKVKHEGNGRSLFVMRLQQTQA